MLNVDIRKNGRDFYNISFLYEKDLVENIKTLPKREYDSNSKTWKLNTINLFELIKKYKGKSNEIFFNFIENGEKEKFIKKYNNELIKQQKEEERISNLFKLKDECNQLRKELMSLETVPLDYEKYLNKGITPYEYQKVAAIFAHKLKKCLFAMQMGTGKTLCSLLASEMYEESVKKVLIICPNSLKFNWGLEILKFCGKPYYILNEKKKSSNIYTVEESKYFIINYEAFNRSNFDPYNKLHSFGLKKIDMLICDESHKLKNSKSNTVKNIRKLFKNKVDRVILASGTIMPNRITDLFIQLNMLDQDAFPSKNRFYNEYCNMVFNIETNSWDEISTPNYEKLHEDLSHIMFRVKLKDVVKGLPDLIVNKVYLEMTSEQEKEYNKIENQFNDISWDEDNGFRDSSPSLVIMNKLRQYTSSIKLDTVKDFIDDLNEEENKVLVFDCFKKPLYELNERFNNSSVYSGDIESSERQELVNKFQKSNNKDLMNLLITMQSGNFGITLTEASKIVVLNQSFVPSENEQCYARAHRIGQKNSVMVYIFIFKNSIDDLIDKAINNKQIGISKVVDGEDFSDTSNSSTLSEVMNIYKKRFKK